MEAIKASLTKFGQVKPIVVDCHNQVIAGNGTLAAATELKWETIKIVRTPLDGLQAEAYAIADNKTTDLSEFNYELLSQVLVDLKEASIDVGLTGFRSFEVEPLFKTDWAVAGKPTGNKPPGSEGSSRFVQFTESEFEIIQEAIKVFSAEEKEFDTASLNGALTAICYRYLGTKGLNK